MKGQEFKGWTHIFAFTMKQNNKSKGFQVTTILIASILFISMITFSLLNIYKARKIIPIKGSLKNKITQFPVSLIH